MMPLHLLRRNRGRIEKMQEPMLSDMKEQLSDLKKRIMTLEWDKSHNQLNSSMEVKYAQIKTEHDSLQKKVDGIIATMKEQEVVAAPVAETQ